MKKLIQLLFLCLCFVALPAFSQQDTIVRKLENFVLNVNTFNYLFPQEKVYLHFDNTGYYLGEKIWFKAYVVFGEQNLYTEMSRVLYVELLSPEGDIVETQKLKIEDGQCSGSFLLKDDFFGGFYEVRAYTKVMLNFGKETVFSRVFPVFDKPSKEGEYGKLSMNFRAHSQKIPFKREDPEEKLKDINLSFFPEGGQLVKGVSSRVAFKATNDKGMGISVKGVLYNKEKEDIASFVSYHDGMGFFEFTPDEGQYMVRINYEGKERSFKMPQAESLGYVMRVDNLRDDYMYIQLLGIPDSSPEKLGLSFACRGKIYAFEAISLDETGKCMLKMPKINLPAGVNQLTLFNAEGRIYAERLAFINHSAERLSVTQTQNKKSYQPFEKVEMGFSVNDKMGNPVKTSFSLSVRDYSSEIGVWQENIETNLLLSSDLKGFINDAEYYFGPDDRQHRLAADLLMMVQGWRRYSWEVMAGVKKMDFPHKIEKGIVIDGQVLSVFKKKGKKNLEVTMWMYSEGGESQQGICPTDDEGRFNFLPKDFYGTWDLSLQTKEKGKRKENRILLNRLFAPDARAYTAFDTRVLEREETISQPEVKEESVPAMTEEDTLDLHKIIVNTHLLPLATIKEKRPWDMKNEGLRFANIVYDVRKEVSDLEDQGKDYVNDYKEFLVQKNKYFTLTYGSSGYGDLKYKNRPVNVLINNRTPFYLEQIYLSDIESIIISESPTAATLYGGESGSVVVYLYTYKKGQGRESPRGIRQTKLQGFATLQEFYNPDYTGGVLPDEKDYRRTLYWNPDVKTDATGKVSVIFYNNSSCQKMTISAEGLTKQGIPVVYNSNN